MNTFFYISHNYFKDGSDFGTGSGCTLFLEALFANLLYIPYTRYLYFMQYSLYSLSSFCTADGSELQAVLEKMQYLDHYLYVYIGYNTCQAQT